MFCGSNPFKIHVHYLKSTTHITSWTHPTFLNTSQRMCLMGENLLAVGDWPSKQIIIYTLTGEVIRRVPCPSSLTMTSSVCMSRCGEDSVVISDWGSGKVVRMSLKDGSLLWSSDRVTNPGGIVHHPAGYVLVVSNYVDNTTIYVLNEKDGWYCNIAVVSRSFSYPDGCDTWIKHIILLIQCFHSRKLDQNIWYICLTWTFSFLLKYSVKLNLNVFPFLGKLVTVLIDETTRPKTYSYDLCLYDDTLVVPRSDKSVVIYELTYWTYMTGIITINLMIAWRLIGEMSG